MLLLLRRLPSLQGKQLFVITTSFHTNGQQNSDHAADACNVSRLPEHLKNEPAEALTLDDKRRLFGRIGLASKVEPSLLWPVRSEFEELLQYQNQFEPSLETLLSNVRQKQEAESKAMREREEKVERSMAKMPDLIKNFHAKKQRRAGEISRIDEKRQTLLDEAREYFGYDVSPRDPRFLELVERKQEEEKRLKKKMRKEKRVERTVLSLTGGQVPPAGGKKGDVAAPSDESAKEPST